MKTTEDRKSEEAHANRAGFTSEPIPKDGGGHATDVGRVRVVGQEAVVMDEDGDIRRAKPKEVLALLREFQAKYDSGAGLTGVENAEWTELKLQAQEYALAGALKD